MPKIILKCPYLKSGSTAHKKNMVEYIATRKGVQKLEIKNKDYPVTKKQEEFIEQLLKEFPNSKNLFEYEDYLQNKTLENATEFISITLEHNLDVVAKKENYVDYIANRPRVDKLTSHGLFSGSDEKIILSKVAKRVAEHEGNVWLPIISLRREDAVNTGFDNAERWKSFLSFYSQTLAENLKIPYEDFRWYASFHDESHHPHIHMICYSESSRYGYLNKKGIENIKSGLVSGIFKMEMKEIYAQQTLRRGELKAESKKAVEQLIFNIANGEIKNEKLEKMLVELSENLKYTKGKRVYGYLPPRIKKMVDNITDQIEKEPSVAKTYDLWCELKNKVVHNYSDKDITREPLSKQKEFKSIKNHIIYEADKLSKGEISLTELEDVVQLEQESISEDEFITATFTEPLDAEKNIKTKKHSVPYVKWTDEYKEARAFLFGIKDKEPDFKSAFELLRAESQNGNMLAVFDLGRMYADGLGVKIDIEKSQEYYKQALNAFESLENIKPWKYLEYRIGKMYAGGLGTEQNYELAVKWFEKSAEQENEWAAYSLVKIHFTDEGYKDIPKAVHWLEQSAGQNNQFAQYQLGKLFLTGENVPQDVNKAVEYLTASAEQKNQFAEYQVGKLYLQGEQIEKNTEKAIRYFTSSAEQGNQFSQYVLGKLYLMGKEVEQDKETAIKCFTLSAEQGNEYAQFFLDNMDKWKEPSVSFAAIRLLHHMSEIFEDKQPQLPKPVMEMKIDSKRLKKLTEKKMASGQKVDDIEMQATY